ncbi:hypothetical protein [Tautonia rosea]|uniref:hypothetical protein n=1 Tax=Tautonia rosea TaxID=2728037 RepID=UPI001474E241|nr:hypothetical protein [Tautonia rosea]
MSKRIGEEVRLILASFEAISAWICVRAVLASFDGEWSLDLIEKTCPESRSSAVVAVVCGSEGGVGAGLVSDCVAHLFIIEAGA